MQARHHSAYPKKTRNFETKYENMINVPLKQMFNVDDEQKPGKIINIYSRYWEISR